MEMKSNNIDVFEEKGIKNSKLILRNLNINNESYETKLLSEESIENVVKFQVIYEGENRALLYDVSGTISLEEYLKSNKLRKEDVCDLVIAIDGMLTSLENYLISENSLTLDHRLIRIVKNDNSKMKLSFVVIPNYNVDFSYELSKFLIRVLRYIDVEDKDALNLAYGLFVRSSKENYVISDLMELVDAVKLSDKNDLCRYDADEYIDYDEKLISEMEENEIEPEFLNNSLENYADFEVDDNTMDFLEEELLHDFNKADKKIIKFNKDSKKKKRKLLNAHIDLDFICYVFTPVIMIIVPILYYFIHGADGLMNNLWKVVAFEITILVIFTLSRIINYRMRRA